MTLRIGLLSASRIGRPAVLEPAREVDGVEVTAVAARDLARAQQEAADWHIPHAYGSYEELLASDEVDAVYIATPASLHRPWAIAAIEAGKHVLCEKPFAANADDARHIADAARDADVVVMEAFHWRYHPCADQIRTVLDSGVLGDLVRVEGVFDLPDGHIPHTDIRWDLSLGGGATMDLGCYPIQWVRFVVGDEPEVVSAEAVCPVEGIDGSLVAELRWPSGVTGQIRSSMIATDDGAADLVVRGTRGTLTVTNPLAPQRGAAIVVETDDGERVDTAVASTATYVHQLVAFRDAVAEGRPFPTTADDAVRNMEVVDACYRAAGLAPRPTMT